MLQTIYWKTTLKTRSYIEGLPDDRLIPFNIYMKIEARGSFIRCWHFCWRGSPFIGWSRGDWIFLGMWGRGGCPRLARLWGSILLVRNCRCLLRCLVVLRQKGGADFLSHYFPSASLNTVQSPPTVSRTQKSTYLNTPAAAGSDSSTDKHKNYQVFMIKSKSQLSISHWFFRDSGSELPSGSSSNHRN